MRLLRVLCATWLAAGTATGLAADAYPEAAVKAAFLLRFAEYVEWPAPQQGEFVIAVLGREPITPMLQQFATRPLHGRPVRIRSVASLAEARDAQILYVGAARRLDLRVQQRGGPGPGTLVVSDAVDGLARGSAINFLRAGGRVRFEVSLAAARRANLRISAELLSVAERVLE